MASHLRAVHEGEASSERQRREGAAVDGVEPPGASPLRERARPPWSLHQPAQHRGPIAVHCKGTLVSSVSGAGKTCGSIVTVTRVLQN